MRKEKSSERSDSQKNKNLNRFSEYLLLVMILLFFGYLVYSPHIHYKYPFHADEWYHIGEAIKISDNENIDRNTLHYPFQFLLSLTVPFIDLVMAYKFFPLVWALLSGLILYLIVKRLTSSIEISILSVLFLASIQSNINLLGNWFFVPLSFSIPLIFLYMYLYSSGIDKGDDKKIIYSIIIMAFVLMVHPISILFAVPCLTLYTLIRWKDALRNRTVLLSLFLLPVVGIVLLVFTLNKGLSYGIDYLTSTIIFRYGWGESEMMNPITEIIPIIVILLAIIGGIIIMKRKETKKYLIYLLWPITVYSMLWIFRLFEISPLSPYQRNMYYFAISLPFLAAYGTKALTDFMDIHRWKAYLKGTLLAIVIFFCFIGYYTKPYDVTLYRFIDDADYDDLIRLKDYPQGRIIAQPGISSTIFPISGHVPIATAYWDGNKKILREFYENDDCSNRERIIKQTRTKYVISAEPLNCSWKELEGFNNIIYQIK